VLVQQAALHCECAPEIAYTRFHDSLPQIRAVGDGYLLAMSLFYLGEVALNLGHVREAEQVFTEAWTCSAQMHNGIMEVAALAGLATVACAREAWADAITHALHAVTRSTEVGEVWSRAKALVVLGEAERGAGDHTAARNTLTDAMRLSLATGLLPIAIQAWVGLAMLDLPREGCCPALLRLVALVRQHPATNRRTSTLVDHLWNVVVAQADPPLLAEAERSAFLTEPAHLAPLLAAYDESRASRVVAK
jgi:hypothetical protein